MGERSDYIDAVPNIDNYWDSSIYLLQKK